MKSYVDQLHDKLTEMGVRRISLTPAQLFNKTDPVTSEELAKDVIRMLEECETLECVDLTTVVL